MNPHDFDELYRKMSFQKALFDQIKDKLRNYIEVSRSKLINLDHESYEVKKLKEVSKRILFELTKFDKQMSQMEELMDDNEPPELRSLSTHVSQTAVNIKYFIELRDHLKSEILEKIPSGDLH